MSHTFVVDKDCLGLALTSGPVPSPVYIWVEYNLVRSHWQRRVGT